MKAVLLAYVSATMQALTERSKFKQAHSRKMLSNPSVEPTNCGKPQSAAHLER